jgi:RNA-binding protein YhbY
MKGKDRAKLRKEGQSVPITLEIGKTGLGPTIVKELKKQLETRTLVKVQIRRSAAGSDDIDETAKRLADEAGAFLVEVRGKNAVYARGGGSSRPRSS